MTDPSRKGITLHVNIPEHVVGMYGLSIGREAKPFPEGGCVESRLQEWQARRERRLEEESLEDGVRTMLAYVFEARTHYLRGDYKRALEDLAKAEWALNALAVYSGGEEGISYAAEPGVPESKRFCVLNDARAYVLSQREAIKDLQAAAGAQTEEAECRA